jgi:hypothetical protein
MWRSGMWRRGPLEKTGLLPYEELAGRLVAWIQD